MLSPNPTHVRLRATGERLIARHGREVDLITYGNVGKSYDPVRDVKSVLTALAVFVDPTGLLNQLEEDVNLIQDNAKLVFISGFVEVQEGMRIREKPGAGEGLTAGSTPLEYSVTRSLDAWPGVINVVNKVLVKL